MDEPADEEELGWGGFARSVVAAGTSTPLRITRTFVRAEARDGVGDRVGHGYGDADTPVFSKPQERREALRERAYTLAVQRGHERAPGGQGRGDRGQPVRVHEIGAASGPPDRPGHEAKQRRTAHGLRIAFFVSPAP